MASTSETGHNKNIANFQTLISYCTSYGAIYNPSRADLQIANLNNLYTDARNSVINLNTAKGDYVNAVNQRQALFEPLKKLCTRIMNALKATEASGKFIDDMKTINNKIQGRRSKPKTNTINDNLEIEEKTISVSQQSYDNITTNFEQFIQLLQTEPSYTPNETELQIATLENTVQDLANANLAVTNAYMTYNNTRIARNNMLYAPETGLVYIAADIKNYLRSIFGTTSPEFKQANALEFKKQTI